MLKPNDLSRRGFVIAASSAAAAALTPRAFAENMGGERIAPSVATEAFNPDVEIELVAKRDSVQILPGKTTDVWRYVGNLVKGPVNSLTTAPDGYLGPLMRFVKDQKIRIRLKNDLPQSTITHWHGLHVPMVADGHPAAAIDPGGTYVYEFEMRNRASMNFYHPHPHEETATQVYRGLAGGIIVEDEEERALGLPAGEYEIPLVIQDRSFTSDNQLSYPGGDMHTGMFGFYGDHILVNGQKDFKLDVASHAYRLRILNASNARIYKLGWDDGTPLTVIGVDGGLLETPEARPYLMLAPSERVDLWVDFSGRAVGSKLTMRSGEFSGLLPMMAMRMMGGGERPMGSDYPVFTVAVTRAGGESPKLPEKLSTIKRYSREEIANPDNPLPIVIIEAPMTMVLNGRAYEHDNVLPVERVKMGSVQLIEIFHDHSGGGMGSMGGMGGMRGRMGGGMMGGGMMNFMMAHPIHLHGLPFQIVSRTFEGDESAYASIKDGFVDSGLKDTVLTTPGMRVRIAKPFFDFKGRFLYHCHNLEHEDMGMMREYSVE